MKKIGLISLALVLALGTLGIAYAAWTDTVVIEQTVATGDLEVGIRDVGTNDNPIDPTTGVDTDGVVNPGWSGTTGDTVSKDPKLGGGDHGKDVANTVSVNEGGIYFTTGAGVKFYQSVSDTISNAYPSYAPTIVWELLNNGNIPVKLKIISFVMSADPNGLDPFVDVPKWEATLNGTPDASDINLTSLFIYLEGKQLEPGDILRVELTKHILQEVLINNVLVECPQNASVTYTLTVDAIQWNKY